MTTEDDVAALHTMLSRLSVSITTELDLQDAIAEHFDRSSRPYRREVRLSHLDKIDFLVGRIGIEVKTEGTLPQLTRQIYRYSKHDDLDAVLVVTNKSRLSQDIPTRINGKPVGVCFLSHCSF